MLLPLILATSAGAVTLGAGVDVGYDLPDDHDPAEPNARTWFPIGLAVRVPVSVPISATAGLRITPRLEGADGRSLVRLDPGDGVGVTDTASAWYTSAGLLVGPEARFGRGPVTPALAAGLGGVYAVTFHNLDRCGWLADASSLEGCGGTEPAPGIDPLTSQLAPAVEASFGLRFLPEDPGTGAWVDLSYGSVGLAAAGFGERAVVGLERAPYVYNAVRLSVGILFGAER